MPENEVYMVVSRTEIYIVVGALSSAIIVLYGFVKKLYNDMSKLATSLRDQCEKEKRDLRGYFMQVVSSVTCAQGNCQDRKPLDVSHLQNVDVSGRS